jgi:hypothetical protein
VDDRIVDVCVIDDNDPDDVIVLDGPPQPPPVVTRTSDSDCVVVVDRLNAGDLARHQVELPDSSEPRGARACKRLGGYADADISFMSDDRDTSMDLDESIESSETFVGRLDLSSEFDPLPVAQSLSAKKKRRPLSEDMGYSRPRRKRRKKLNTSFASSEGSFADVVEHTSSFDLRLVALFFCKLLNELLEFRNTVE